MQTQIIVLASEYGRNDILDLFRDVEDTNLDFDILMQNSIKSESFKCAEIIKKMSKSYKFNQETLRTAMKSEIVKIIRIFNERYDEKFSEDMKVNVIERILNKETVDIHGRKTKLLFWGISRRTHLLNYHFLKHPVSFYCLFFI